MIAERHRRPLRNKNKVNVQSESDQVTPIEESVTTTTRKFGLGIGTHNAASTEITTLPITTQETFSSTKTSEIEQQVIALIQEGRRQASEGDYRGAIDTFNKVLPATFDSLYYRGCARLQLGEQIEIHNAIEEFNQALKVSPALNNPNIYYKRAFTYQLIGRYTEAIIDYTRFINYSPSDEQHKGYLNRGLVYSEIKHYDKALEDIRYAYTSDPKVSKYYVYCLARAEASVGHNDKAHAKFSELENICKNECDTPRKSFDSLFYYGIALYELNKYPDALKLFNEAFECSKTNSQKADIKFYIGLIYYAVENIKTAEDELKNALEYDKNHTRALFRLGLIESQNNVSQSKALTYLTKAHELAPHKSDILYERGELHHKMGRLDACVRDKRLALQLERTDADLSAIKYCYELLIERLLSMNKQPDMSDNTRMMRTLLYDKIHTLSQDASRSSIFDKDYRQMILMYEQEIDKNKEAIYSPIYYALLCNLHKNHKHAGAAMIAHDQLHHLLDSKPELQRDWDQMLNGVREMAKKQNASQSDNLQKVLEMINSQMSKFSNNQESNAMLISLLAERIAVFEKIEESRNQVKIDKEHFNKDRNENKNRFDFYDKMRISLSHKFASMAVISGDDHNEPIVKHDVTGTETMIAQGVCLLGDVLGAVMPYGGGVLSTLCDQLSSQLQKHEYNRYQNRMALVTDVGTIEELTDVARRVARKLADCYEDQLLSLNRRPDEVPQTCSSCCPWFRNDSSNEKPPIKVIQPMEQIAQVGIAFAVEGTVHGKIENWQLNDDTKCEDLANAITKLICSAKPNIKTKLFRRLNVDKNMILPHTPLQNLKEEEPLNKWYLHDFYHKPGIYIQSGEEKINKKPLSWMNPDIYGHRLGTLDEYNDLDELDKKQTKNKSKECCCC